MFLNPRWKAIYFEQAHSSVSNMEENYAYSANCYDFSSHFISLLSIKCCDFAFESMIFFSSSTSLIILILENSGLHFIATLNICFIVVNSEFKLLDIMTYRIRNPLTFREK